MANIHQQTGFDMLGNLMENSRYSDLAIVCEGKRFNVHKNIMCSASRTIAAICDNGMEEAQTGIIRHKEFDVDTVERMIEYVYKRRYELPDDLSMIVITSLDSDEHDVDGHGNPSDPKQSITSVADQNCTEQSESAETKMDDRMQGNCPKSSLEMSGANAKLIAHARMYAIGQYYDIPALREFAEEQFDAETGWQMEGFVEAIKEIRRLTFPGNPVLRSALCRKAVTHIDELAEDESFMAELADRDGVQEFTADLLKCVVVQNAEEKHAQQKLRDADLSKFRNLEGELRDSQADTVSVTEKLSHTKELMHNLVEILENMPDQCRNPRCGKTFDRLMFEQKGSKYGSNTGSWVVKCERCGCDLCKYVRNR